MNEIERERKRTPKICHICQTQSKSSKRARNVKLMALTLHRNQKEAQTVTQEEEENRRRTKQNIKW